MSWYSKGFDGLAREEARIQASQTPNRFWVPVGERREVVFVDDEPMQVYEHNPKMNGSWRNWFTCLRDIEDPCPACDIFGEKTRYLVGFLTCVDVSKWVDKKGNAHQFELSFFAAKVGMMKKLKRKIEDAKEAERSFAGSLYRASRDTDKEPSSGSELEYIRAADTAKLFELAMYRGKKVSDLFDKAEQNAQLMEALKHTFQLKFDDTGKPVRELPAFNYLELLHPKPRKELAAMLKGAKQDSDDGDDNKSSGKKDQGGERDGDNEVPF
jgi:hypothetical protein